MKWTHPRQYGSGHTQLVQLVHSWQPVLWCNLYALACLHEEGSCTKYLSIWRCLSQSCSMYLRSVIFVEAAVFCLIPVNAATTLLTSVSFVAE